MREYPGYEWVSYEFMMVCIQIFTPRILIPSYSALPRIFAVHYVYPDMQKKLGDFQMNIIAGDFKDSEIVVLLGENGTGKTTFIRMYNPILLSFSVMLTILLLLFFIYKAPPICTRITQRYVRVFTPPPFLPPPFLPPPLPRSPPPPSASNKLTSTVVHIVLCI